MLSRWCDKCDYLSKERDGDRVCIYCLVEGKHRPCKAGDYCKCHTNPPKHYEPSKEHRRGEWDKKLARKLFDAGKNDDEIARAVGMSERTVSVWRSKNHLRRKVTEYARRKNET